MESLPNDIIVFLATFMDLDSVHQLCQTSSRLNRLICNNRNFWIRRLKQDYNIDPEDLDSEEYLDPKNTYKIIKNKIDKIIYDPNNKFYALSNAALEGNLLYVKALIHLGHREYLYYDCYRYFTVDELPEVITYSLTNLDVFKYLVPFLKKPLTQEHLNSLLYDAARENLEVVKYLVEELGAINESALENAREGLDLIDDPLDPDPEADERRKIVQYLEKLSF